MPVAALLLSVAILLMGNGLQSMLIPIRANMEGFSSFQLGFLGAAYFGGFALGCIFGGGLIGQTGHIRLYLAMTSIASGVVLCHAMVVSPPVWWLLRMISGFCFAVITIIIESWINARASNSSRGAVFSVYTGINLSVITIGQMLIAFGDPRAFTLFAVVSILISLAALPIALIASRGPQRGAVTRPSLPRLADVSPVGFAGCAAVGLANGAVWAFGPVFMQTRGLDVAGTAYFMSAVVLGGAIAQWPLGALSDTLDRRVVIIGAAALAIGSALLLMVASDVPFGLTIALGAMFGAGAFPIYALSVAHANDFTEPRHYVEVSSALLLVYGIGAALGPVVYALMRALSGSSQLFFYTAFVHGVLTLYIVWRMSRRAPPPAAERVTFSEAAIAAQTVIPVEIEPQEREPA